MRQEFVKLDASQNSCFPQIQCFSLSEDKKFLVAGTIEQQAKIIIWDICSRTCIKTLRITNSPMILKVKFAHDNKHIVVVALTNEYTICIYLIDSSQSQILGCANFPYSLPFKIKDLAFFPNSIYQFITCGIQNMTYWKFNGQFLQYKSMEIENPPINKVRKSEDYSNMDGNKDDELDKDDDYDEEEYQQPLKVTFLCIVFVQDVMITSSEDGCLYIWDEVKIIQKVVVNKQDYNQSVAIGTLSAKRDSNLFVSGSLDGIVILWEITAVNQSFNIIKIQEYNLSNYNTEIDSKMMPEFKIQSICIGSKYILAGTMNGDIYELLLPQYSEEDYYIDQLNLCQKHLD